MGYIVRTQKPTEGTGHGSLARVKGANSNYFRRNQNGTSHIPWC